MEAIIAAVSCIIVGAAIIGKAVYDRNFRNFTPDPKKWGRARAKITGRHYYRKRRIPTKNNPRDSEEGFEKSITYVVNGITYEKYVDDSESGAVHIFYRLDNPNIIKTMTEIKRKKWEARSQGGFGMIIFFGAIPLIVGASILLTIFLEG